MNIICGHDEEDSNLQNNDDQEGWGPDDGAIGYWVPLEKKSEVEKKVEVCSL